MVANKSSPFLLDKKRPPVMGGLDNRKRAFQALAWGAEAGAAGVAAGAGVAGAAVGAEAGVAALLGLEARFLRFR